MVRLRPMALE